MKSYIKQVAALVLLGSAGLFAACEKTDAEIDRDKTPSIEYARYCDPDSVSPITSAYLGEKIAFIGSGMGDVREIWFNDQKATLNPNYITSDAIIVDIPKGISENETGKVRFVTSKGHEALFDFKVLVPAPLMENMDCEWAEPGSIATINGDYFVDDKDNPFRLVLGDGTEVPHDDITIISRYKLTFKVPQNAPEGFLSATSRYGTAKSNFVFHDTRGMLFDWDGVHGQALARANGWRTGDGTVMNNYEGIPPLDGNYICFNGVKANYNDAQEPLYAFTHWSVYEGEGHNPGLDPSTLFDAANFLKWQIKFEAFVPQAIPWRLCSLQAFCTPADVNNTNDYLWDEDFPRGLWTPWKNAKDEKYDTGGKWITVSMPLKDFNKGQYGAASSQSLTPKWFKGLTFIVVYGPAPKEGENLVNVPTVIAIDNVRFAPLYEKEYLNKPFNSRKQ